ncbi:hypothetical protein OAT16_05370 [Prolixibacteraceae bacterium]|nr:hypothetical protein [Prolixibacteraceae bacterium]
MKYLAVILLFALIGCRDKTTKKHPQNIKKEVTSSQLDKTKKRADENEEKHLKSKKKTRKRRKRSKRRKR